MKLKKKKLKNLKQLNKKKKMTNYDFILLK